MIENVNIFLILAAGFIAMASPRPRDIGNSRHVRIKWTALWIGAGGGRDVRVGFVVSSGGAWARRADGSQCVGV